jgi:hypothetical protein
MLAALASCEHGGATEGGNEEVGDGDGEDDEGRWVWNGGESEEMTGGTLTLEMFG